LGTEFGRPVHEPSSERRTAFRAVPSPRREVAVQANTQVGRADDSLEREADRVADAVVSLFGGAGAPVQTRIVRRAGDVVYDDLDPARVHTDVLGDRSVDVRRRSVGLNTSALAGRASRIAPAAMLVQRKIAGGVEGDRVINTETKAQFTITKRSQDDVKGTRYELMPDDPNGAMVTVDGEVPAFALRPRPAADLTIMGPMGVAADMLGLVAFEGQRATLTPEYETRLAQLSPALTRAVVVRGHFSEDEGRPVAVERANAVARCLVANGVKVPIKAESSAAGTAGNFNYRAMRKVEVWFADEAPVPPADVAVGRVRSTDAGYANYGVAGALEKAAELLDKAIGRLAGLTKATPHDDPTMRSFRRFFAAAEPAAISRRLKSTRDQLAHYHAEAPDADDDKGGHACFDESKGGLQFLNQGVGGQARMLVGVAAKSATPGNRAYNTVHEATHGAPDLQTVDRAYYWEQLFPHLTTDEQWENADSYAMLVSVLGGLAEADGTNPVPDLDAPGVISGRVYKLDSEDEKRAMTAWSWLEHYITHVFLNMRDLYFSVSAGHTPQEGSFLNLLWRDVCDLFKLPGDDYASIASMVRALKDLSDLMSVEDNDRLRPVFYRDEKVPPPKTMGRPALLRATTLPAIIIEQFYFATEYVEQTAGPRYDAYRELLVRTVKNARWGGPLGG
jgi:hypothetical protein